MDTKKIFLICSIFLLTTQACFAGDTTIKGTMSCYIPPQIEMRTQNDRGLTEQEAPAVTTSSGYDITKEEKIVNNDELLQTEQTSVATSDTGTQRQVTVYSICAK